MKPKCYGLAWNKNSKKLHKCMKTYSRKNRRPLSDVTNIAHKFKSQKLVDQMKDDDSDNISIHVQKEPEKVKSGSVIVQNLLQDVDQIITKDLSFADKTLIIRDEFDLSVEKLLVTSEERISSPSDSASNSLQHGIKKRRRVKKICMPRPKRKQRALNQKRKQTEPYLQRRISNSALRDQIWVKRDLLN